MFVESILKLSFEQAPQHPGRLFMKLHALSEEIR